MKSRSVQAGKSFIIKQGRGSSVVEQPIRNRQVVGSTPTLGSTILSCPATSISLASFAFFPPSHSRGLFVFQRLRQFWFRLAANDLPMHVHASRESSEDTAGRSPVRRTGCLPALAGNTPHRRRFRLLRKCFSSRHCLRRIA